MSWQMCSNKCTPHVYLIPSTKVCSKVAAKVQFLQFWMQEGWANNIASLPQRAQSISAGAQQNVQLGMSARLMLRSTCTSTLCEESSLPIWRIIEILATWMKFPKSWTFEISILKHAVCPLNIHNFKIKWSIVLRKTENKSEKLI